MKGVVAAVALIGSLAVPGFAKADSSTDAALGLGAFAVFNQFLSGTGVFGGRTVVVERPVVYAPPPPVVYAPAPGPVVVYPAPPAVVYRAPGVVYAPAPVYGYSNGHGHWKHAKHWKRHHHWRHDD